MLKKMLIMVAAAALAVFCMSGCKKGPGEAEPNEVALKTIAEYEAEAKDEIKKENMGAKLEEIKKELAAEPAAK